MKKVLKYAGYLVAILLLVISVLLLYVRMALPNVPAPELTIDVTEERIKRGDYLANSVAVCMDCHSKRDWAKFSAPLTPGTLGMGGDRFDQAMGMPGIFYAKNITPAGIARYTDGELYRVITSGVTKEGKAMFPFMPSSIIAAWTRKIFIASLRICVRLNHLRTKCLILNRTSP
ncbi:MAG: hypothetical protein RLN86_06420 [Cyclobacteriaceae bacterium]